MGNCCAVPLTSDENKHKKKNKLFPFAIDYGGGNGNGGYKTQELDNPTGHEIEQKYELGVELGRGEFGVPYLCIDRDSGEKFACKSISKTKLLTRVDIEDVRRVVGIMKHLPSHPNIVSLRSPLHKYQSSHSYGLL